VSPHIEVVLGYDQDEWIAAQHLWLDRLHPDDRDEVVDETARSVESGEGFKLEYRMIAKDGRVVWLHDVASVMARDATGRATRYQGVLLDITDRKQAEHARRQGRHADDVLDGEAGDPAGEPIREEVLGPLSQREHEVAELLALGHTNSEIAAILHLSVRTIEHHRARVFRKLGVRSRAGLVQALRGVSRPSSDD
jgi:PAS domain S-box-containing protein